MQRPVGEQRRTTDNERVSLDDALDTEPLAVDELLDPRQVGFRGRGFRDRTSAAISSSWLLRRLRSSHG